MRTPRGFRWLLAAALLALPWAGELAAQGVTTSAVTGRVTDAEGTPLAGVQVVVLNRATGSQRGVLTQANGRFLLPGLRPGGPYRVEAQFIGYATETVDDVFLALGETRAVNFTLRTQAVAIEGIEVTAERGANLQSGVSTVVDSRTIETAPTLGREFVDVVRFTPQAFVSNEDDDGAAISIAGQNAEYNGLFIDGVVNNDVFGLSAQGTNGGQTGAPPISFDAIEQLQIAVSPFDVTQSGFTGGAINAITRSGTNRLEGSFYYQFRNQDLAGKTPGDVDDPEKLPEFSNARYGFRLGGPIRQNKLFFFVNGEMFRSETPRPFTPGAYRGDSGGQLDMLRQLLIDEVGYDPGDYGAKASKLDDNKLLVKLDWNINENHRLALRHSYSKSENIDAFESDADDINFSNTSEVFPNTTNSSALELNSTFGGRYANRFLFGMTFVRDDRGFAGDPFPYVVIEDGAGDIQLGSEQFSTGNILNQDIISITNNLNIFAGRHTITVGTHNEFYDIANLFLRQNFGSYTYESMDDFLQSLCAAGSGQSSYCQNLRQQMGGTITPARPDFFARGFSVVDDVVGDESNAIGAFKAFQLGFYVQDDYQASERLRVQAGLRIDIPKITTKPRHSPDVFDTTIPAIEEHHDLEGARPGETPKAMPYIAPRLGFTYDLEGDGSRTLRGGLGLFTGRVPFVYPGAMYLNNGATAGYISTGSGRLPNGDPIPFIPNPSQGLDARDFGQNPIPSGELDIFTEDFRYPRVFRASLGLDTQLPGGLVGTLEGQYTKSLDNIIVTNVNLKPQNDRLDGPDNRPVYNYGTSRGGLDPGSSVIDSRYTSILKVGSTSEGYAYDITASLQKEFGDYLSTRLAFSYGDAYSLNDATSDQIFSVWRFNENVKGLNNLELARSDWSMGARVLAMATYRREFLERLGTTITAIYTAESGRPFSYIIGNNFRFTGEGSGTAPLAYIPRDASELQFESYTDRDGRTWTPQEQADALDRLIDSSDYLSGRRGDYAERNGDRGPTEHVVDLRIAQEIFTNVAGRRNTVELTLDIFNFTAMLNKEWGRRYDLGFRTVDLLRFEEFRDPANGDLTPIYTFRLTDVEDLDEYWNQRLLDFGNYGSRWLMQFGMRYTF